ncbi:MAG: phosphoribosylformylglycinamidine synthase [Chloroflexi bacterium]|nr:MAG: phosphoribosylformylglycinamidine synthase [Chloroflexota bacterium]
MRFGIVVFPGTWSDTDCYHAVTEVLNQDAQYIWHQESNIRDIDCLVLPGGFSYGDYLRTGAIARFSPVMSAIKKFANDGGLVIGICNGFQILCEAQLLPGVLIRNDDLRFRCEWTNLKIENNGTKFTSRASQKELIKVPISHGEGNYYADSKTIDTLNNNGQVVFRYCSPSGQIDAESNPNGSIENIAGIVNDQGNVMGMMPHPERCCEEIIGGTDGRIIFESMIDSVP